MSTKRKLKLPILQYLLFVSIGFGLLFVNADLAFIYLIVVNAIIILLQYRTKKVKASE